MASKLLPRTYRFEVPARMAISRILITGDVLRPHPGDPSRSESVARIRWLEDLLTPSLSQVTDLPVARLACDKALDFKTMYRDCGLEPSLDAWAEMYAGDLPSTLEERILEACQDALVISLEMSPALAGVLARAGVPLLDSLVDPLRFLFDIPLAWRSPNTALHSALLPFGVTSYEVAHRVGQIRAKMRWLPPPAIPEGATLLLDQLPSDAAMIDPRHRRRVTWSDYVEQVRALERQGPVVWRPHPYNSDTAVLVDILGHEAMRSENFYSLLTQDALVRVAAISSGGVLEARAFGKEGLHLMDRYAGIDVPGWTSPVPVIGHWLSPHFFSVVLAGAIDTCADVPKLPVERDSFRRANNTDWDFGWIDQVVERRSARLRESAIVGASLQHLQQGSIEASQRVEQLETRAGRIDEQAERIDERVALVEQRLNAEAIALTADRARLAAHAHMADQQLRRLQDADRPRLRALVDDVAQRARVNGWRVGVLGAGAHTAWMLKETSLRSVQALFLFDSQRTVASLEGLPVHPAGDIPAMDLHVVIVSSLAFQDEMQAYLRALDFPDVQIVVCYPLEGDADVAA